ncbi:hypothetical protein KIPB_007776, partial [Kipferlia bialata]|eukprot:g7776.t1
MRNLSLCIVLLCLSACLAGSVWSANITSPEGMSP